MTYLDMQIQSVRFITKLTDVGRKSPQDHRGVSFIPGPHPPPPPPSSSLASSSGPPFVPYSSGEEWAIKDAVS